MGSCDWKKCSEIQDGHHLAGAAGESEEQHFSYEGT